MRRRHLLAATPYLFVLPDTRSGARAASAPLRVLYAGSLVRLMETGLFPAWLRAPGGGPAAGYAAGSTAIAHEIAAGLRAGDVFISASPKADALLVGPANGDRVRWWLEFARSPLVLGTVAGGPADRALRSGQPWYAVLASGRFRLGRTDPRLDPKGALTLDLLARAERTYARPGLARAVLGADENAAQVFPEPELVGRLQSGEIDVGFFYSLETAELGLATTALPAAIDPAARYTATVIDGAADPAGAARFVAFLLGPAAATIMRAHGLDRLPAPTLAGDRRAVPPPVLVASGA